MTLVRVRLCGVPLMGAGLQGHLALRWPTREGWISLGGTDPSGAGHSVSAVDGAAEMPHSGTGPAR